MFQVPAGWRMRPRPSTLTFLRTLLLRQAEIVRAAKALVDYEQEAWGTPKYDKFRASTLLAILTAAVNSEREQNYRDPA